MNKKYKVLITMMFAAGIFAAHAQVNDKVTTIGFNVGAMYQQGDVPVHHTGLGGGITLSKSLYRASGSPIAFDLRSRILLGATYGLDHIPNYDITQNDVLNGSNNQILDYSTEDGGPGFVYNNHKTKHRELGVEGVITLNRLREKSNVIVSVFGGLGLDWYKTKIDQMNNGAIYPYGDMSLPDKNRQTIRRDLERNLDGDYETLADGFNNTFGKVGIMPNLGLELGYEIAPHLILSASHRMSFANSDALDGIRFTPENDKYHYTSFGLKWEIPNTKKQVLPPYITLITPDRTNVTTESGYFTLLAEVDHVSKKNAINMTLNNRRTEAFQFSNGRISANFHLEEGRNDLTIVASNAAGSDKMRLVIDYRDGGIDEILFRPVIEVIEPRQAHIRQSENQLFIRAHVTNVRNKGQVELFRNDQSVPFEFNSRTNELTSNIHLYQGNNQIRIEARNDAGSNLAAVVAQFDHAVLQPFVEILSPGPEQNSIYDRTVAFVARTEYVNNDADIQLAVNGYHQDYFGFDGNRVTATIPLQLGHNSIEILISNAHGEAVDHVNVYVEDAQINENEVYPPSCRIEKLWIDEANNCLARFHGWVENVDGKRDIVVLLNGENCVDFSFQPQSGRIEGTLHLREGANQLVLKVLNGYGHADDQAFIDCQKPVFYGPSITMIDPVDHYTTIDENTFAMKARIDQIETRNHVKVHVNGERLTNIHFNRETALLKARLNLRTGENIVRIQADNGHGKDERVVKIRVREIHTPVVQTIKGDGLTNNVEETLEVRFINPAKPISQTNDQSVKVQARLTGVKDKNAMVFKLNNRRIDLFTFSPLSKILEATVDLKEGANTIIVEIRKNGKSASGKRIVSLTLPLPPNILSVSPKNGSSVKEQHIELTATTKNVDKRSGINLELNGVAISNFNFKNNQLTVQLSLKKGRNTVKLNVRNAVGSDHRTVQITYRPAEVLAPIFTKINPLSNEIVARQRRLPFEMELRHVASKKDIQLVLNDKVVTYHTFDGKTGRLTCEFYLRKGNNLLRVIANNQDKTTTEIFSIVYVPLELQVQVKPEIKDIRIERFEVLKRKPIAYRVNFTAHVANVVSAQQITVTVNGKSVTSFTWDRNRLTGSFTIDRPDYHIVLVAATKTSKVKSEKHGQLQIGELPEKGDLADEKVSKPKPVKAPKPGINKAQASNQSTTKMR